MRAHARWPSCSAYPGLDDEHRRRRRDGVLRPAAAARAASADEGAAVESISFLKEQQWALDFGTAVVTEAPVRESVRVPGRIVARPGGAADVVAPIDGRLVRVAELLPGMPQCRGTGARAVQPPPSAPAELPQIRQAQAEAASALKLATRDRERAERLVAGGSRAAEAAGGGACGRGAGAGQTSPAPRRG